MASASNRAARCNHGRKPAKQAKKVAPKPQTVFQRVKSKIFG